MQHQLLTLKNNLKTLLVDAPGSTSATVQIWFRAGSALENKSNEGIAHFLEHMFFKGTPTRPGAAIAHEVESFGGEVNAFTSFDYTCYYINTPNTHLNQTIEILMDMVSNPQFKDEDIIPEIGVVFEEYRRSQDNANQYSFQKLQKSSFTSGYAHPILGNEKTIKGFTREQLIEFREKYYNLSNAMLVVSGDLAKKDQMIKTIEKFQMPEGEKSVFPEFKMKKKPTIELHTKDVRMAQLTMTIQGPTFTAKNASAEDLAFSCLGHGETSRMYKNLVLNDALANASSCSTMFMTKGGVHFTRVVFPLKNIKKVLSTLHKTYKEVTSNGLNDNEIKKIKNQYVASKVYENESLESFAFSLGHGFAQTGNIHADDDFIGRTKKTGKTAVNNALKEIFSRDIHLSLQLPKGESTKDYKAVLEGFQKNMTTLATQLSKKKAKTETGLKSKYDPQVQVIKLKKGVSLLYRHNPMCPTFVLHAYLKGGLTEETETTNGVHHLLSGIINKGYAGMPYEKLRLNLEDKSASLNGFTGKNAYGVTMHGQTEHITDLMNHFFGTFLTPAFPAKKLAHEKEMTLRSLDNQTEDPIRQCFMKVNNMLFAGHPYRRNIVGTEKTVKKITRKSIIDRHANNLNKKEVLITYCGDLELDEVLERMAPHLQKLKPRAEKKVVAKKFKPQTGKHEFQFFDREQTQIFHSIPTAKLGSKENLYLKMLSTHLSGQSSELFVEVRDRQGLCYTAQPIHFTALEAGYFGIYMASGHDKVTPAIAAIKGILADIRANGLSREEFKRIKTMIEGQSLINVQTNEDYANIYSVPTLQGQGLDYYHNNNKAVINLKYEDFQKGLKKILGRKFNTVIVGREDVER
jgi:zinc protease